MNSHITSVKYTISVLGSAFVRSSHAPVPSTA